MSEATNWTELLLAKQQQQAAADRTAQALRQSQLSETLDIAGRLAGAMKQYREDGIAEKLRQEAAHTPSTAEAAAKAGIKASALEQARKSVSPGLGTWFSQAFPGHQTVRPSPAVETHTPGLRRPAAASPSVHTLGTAPTSFVPGAVLFQNQQFFKVNALGQPEPIQTIA